MTFPQLGPKRLAAYSALLFVSVACASSAPTIEGPRPELFGPPAPRTPSGPPPGKLYREDVARVVDAGFPDFLQRLDVEPHLEDGKFVGWTLVALYPRDFWERVDLAPGDVVTSVNGMRIERDTEAFAAFEALKTAPRLVVRYLRRREPREIGFDIVPAPANVAAR